MFWRHFGSIYATISGFWGVQKRISGCSEKDPISAQKISRKPTFFIFDVQIISEGVTLKSFPGIVFDVQTLLSHGGESGQISDLQKS